MQGGLLVIFIGAGATYLCLHHRSIVLAKESQLREDLMLFRTVIHEYTFDHQKTPRTLEDLLQERYLGEVPIDPITGSTTTWQIVMENSENAVNKSAPGIFDVKSGSTKTGHNGKRYSEW
jgi:general secretion pathway protein G